MVGKEIRANFKGILNTPPVEKKMGTHSNQEDMLPRFRSHTRGDHVGNQDHHRIRYNPPLPRIDLLVFCGDNLKRWLRKCNKYFTLKLVLVQ